MNNEIKKKYITVTQLGNKLLVIAEWSGEHPNIKATVLFSGTWNECYEYAESNCLKIEGFNHDSLIS